MAYSVQTQKAMRYMNPPSKNHLFPIFAIAFSLAANGCSMGKTGRALHFTSKVDTPKRCKYLNRRSRLTQPTQTRITTLRQPIIA